MPANHGFTACASFAAADLAVLADQRRATGIRVIAAGTRVWVAWEGDGAGILERVRSLPGSEVYERREELWFRSGCRLPSFGLPVDYEEAISLSQALVPGPVRPIAPTAAELSPCPLTLVPEERPRATTALRCALERLADWAERATAAQLGAVQAAYAGNEVFLTAQTLPPLRGATRYWGRAVFVPLGLRPEPPLSEAALREALGVDAGALVVLERDGFDTIPRSVLRPLTRSGIRLGCSREDRTE